MRQAREQFAHRFALKLKAIGVVNEAVENGIAESRVGNTAVPVRNGKLGGNQGGG